MPIEINTDLYFTENWESEISKTLHTVLNLIVIQMLQIEIVEVNNFFLIIMSDYGTMTNNFYYH